MSAKYTPAWRVVYGETRPAWEQLFSTKHKAVAFAKRAMKRGDIVFSTAKTVRGEKPQSIMAAIAKTDEGRA